MISRLVADCSKRAQPRPGKHGHRWLHDGLVGWRVPQSTPSAAAVDSPCQLDDGNIWGDGLWLQLKVGYLASPSDFTIQTDEATRLFPFRRTYLKHKRDIFMNCYMIYSLTRPQIFVRILMNWYWSWCRKFKCINNFIKNIINCNKTDHSLVWRCCITKTCI